MAETKTKNITKPYGGKHMYELDEGDLIELFKGGEVIFVESKQTNFVFANKEGKLYKTKKTNYKKYLGKQDEDYIEKLQKSKAEDVRITSLKKGDVFTYYRGNDLQKDIFVFIGVRRTRVLAISLATGEGTNFSPSFTVKPINLTETYDKIMKNN